MADVILDSHEVLGKLTIIKNSLFLVMEKAKSQLDEKSQTLLKHAFETNQQLIDLIKSKIQNG